MNKNTYSRIYPNDQEKPYKIVSPKHSIMPLRFSDCQEAEEYFRNIQCQAIFTHTRVKGNNCTTKIIGYKS